MPDLAKAIEEEVVDGQRYFVVRDFFSGVELLRVPEPKDMDEYDDLVEENYKSASDLLATSPSFWSDFLPPGRAQP